MKKKTQIPTWEELQVWSGGKTAIQITHEAQEAMEYCYHTFQDSVNLPRKKKKALRKHLNTLGNEIISVIVGAQPQYYIETEKMKERVWNNIQKTLDIDAYKVSHKEMYPTEINIWTDPEEDHLQVLLSDMAFKEDVRPDIIDNLS